MAEKAILFDALLGHLVDSSGANLAAGTIYFYEVGGAVTPKNVYADRDMTSSLGTSITLDDTGSRLHSSPVFLDRLYYIVIKDVDGNTIETIDGFGKGVTADEIWVDASDYATLNAACTAIGTTTETDLVVGGTIAMNASLNFATTYANIRLRVLRGGEITISTYTLTIPNSNLEAGAYKIWTTTSGSVTGLSFAYPEWWGIDGTADQTEWNKAITAVGNNGTVIATETYSVTAAIDIASNYVTIKSLNSSLINSTGTINTFNITGTNVTLDGLVITGNLSADSYGINASSAATNLIVKNSKVTEFRFGIVTAGANAIIENNTVSTSTIMASQSIGIYVNDTTNALVQGNIVTQPDSAGGVEPIGINVANDATLTLRNKVLNNTVTGGHDGIAIRGQYTVISGNYVESSVESGILLDGGAATNFAAYTIVSNNIVKDCVRNGIWASGTYNHDNTIDSNIVTGCATDGNNEGGITVNMNTLNYDTKTIVSNNIVIAGKHGIYLTSSSGNNAIGVIVSDNNISGSTVTGIAVYRMKEIILNGNRVQGATTYGIDIASDESQYITVTSNVLSGNGTNYHHHTNGVANLIVENNNGIPITLTGAGAIPTYTKITWLVTASGGVAADAVTLANGYEGQIKTIVYKTETDAGDTSVVTPANFGDGTTMTFAEVEDWIMLQFINNQWWVIKNSGVTVA